MYICIMNLPSTFEFYERFNPLTKDRSRGRDVEGFFYGIKSRLIRTDCKPGTRRFKSFLSHITCKAQGSHNASREYVTEKRSLGLHFKTNGILSKDSLKLVSSSQTKEIVNQAPGIKEVSNTQRDSKKESVGFRGGTVTPFKDIKEESRKSRDRLSSSMSWQRHLGLFRADMTRGKDPYFYGYSDD